MIGWSEYLVIFLVVLLLFGAKRIPEIARSLGKAGGEYQKAKKEVAEEIENEKKKAQK
jgi:sec-independent protein translocase protein TatA